MHCLPLKKKGKRVQKQESRWEPWNMQRRGVHGQWGDQCEAHIGYWLGREAQEVPPVHEGACLCHSVLPCERNSCSSPLALDQSLSVSMPVVEGSSPVQHLRVCHLLCCILWVEDEPAPCCWLGHSAGFSFFGPWKATYSVHWGWAYSMGLPWVPALLRNSLKPLVDLIHIVFRGSLLGFLFRGTEVFLSLRSPCLLKEPLLIGDSWSLSRS